MTNLMSFPMIVSRLPTCYHTFTILHLTGLNPTFTSSQHAAWLSDYSTFISELQNNFGLHDPEGEAEASLKNLRKHENQRITKYLVEFNWLAACVQWGDAPLCHQLYNGFPSQIKDEISRVGKLDNLTDLQILAQSIVAQYWEHRNEIAHETPANKTPDKPSDKGKTPTMANPNSGNKNPPNSGTSGNLSLLLWPVLQTLPLPSHLSSGKMAGSLRKRGSIA